MSYILIVGAKSDIAKAVARTYASNGYNLYLAARNVHELEPFSKDIKIRWQVNVKLIEFDVLKYGALSGFYEGLPEKPEGVISAVGYLGDQGKSQENFDEVRTIIGTNFTGIVGLFNIIANDFEKRQKGFIVGISSVAGDRGRKSNYTYGSAKAGFTAYLSGLRNRLCEANVQVLTVKPGFVNTKMTAGMDLPAAITAEPLDVAKDIFRAQQKGANILYTKWLWKWIMFVIKLIPESQFKKMNI
ncbi:SDR family oxidoreductase [bacterium]|nr:SDR family oxidoreductase [bacterium]